jgi:DNA replication protein DnaC
MLMDKLAELATAGNAANRQAGSILLLGPPGVGKPFPLAAVQQHCAASSHHC